MGWERRREGERRENHEGENFRESVSNFSLDFLAIGPSVSGEARSKVAPHDKGYAWAPVLGSFDKLQKVGVFSYLVYSFAKSLVNDLGVVRQEMAMDFDSKEVELKLMKGLSMDSPCTIFGTVKNSPDLCVRPKTSMCICLK